VTPRGRALVIFAGLFLFVLAVAAVLTYTAGLNLRVDDLDRRVVRLETDVSLLLEKKPDLLE
jgi:hypothetical protein